MTRRILAALLAVMMIAGVAFADTKTLTLGSSGYTLTVPASYVNGEVTSEDIAEGQTAYYKSDESDMDFDVYAFTGKGTLEDFARSDAETVKGTDIKTGLTLNGIAATSYRAVQENDGESYNTLTYIFGENGGYVKIVFWLDGKNAEAEADAVISSLKR